MFDRVDPFIGTAATDLPAPQGLAATWWSPKPQVGNTHPGATYPFGMVSVGAYSGAYPTGYGLYDLNTEGMPTRMYEELIASGFTHFHQSGTGAIRKYYNYFRVTPMLEPLDALGSSWQLLDEVAEPGYYAATLSSGIRCEVTVGPRSAVHRYTFPEHHDARIVIDLSLGGLQIPYGGTVPLRALLETVEPGAAQAEVVLEGAPLAVRMECDSPGFHQLLWYDRRLVPGGTRLDFDRIRPTTLRPFGLMWRGPTRAGQVVELRMGFSLRGVEQAGENLRTDCGTGQHRFAARRADTATVWRRHLDTVAVETTSDSRRTIFSTALYHSLIKPCFAAGESPFWPMDGPFVFDLCTMWDIYRTQLPLITALFPDRAVELANALLSICEEEGNLPIGYRMAKGADRFSRQGSALAHTFLADLCQLGLPGIDWEWALCHLDADLRRSYGEEYLLHGVAHPVTHTLDLSVGYHCTAMIARRLGDHRLGEQLENLATRWVNAYDPATGLLIDSTFYEGGRWNYSFRLLPEMSARIRLAGGDERFVSLLDTFFGYGADPVKPLGERPGLDELALGAALNRFEGLNNEPDLEAPWAYHYAGRPDRTAEVVHAAINNQFGLGRGGLPGNDDSGGLSSWYVWASLGLFPAAGQSRYLLNAPSFSEARMTIGERELEIETIGFVEPEPDGPVSYVRSASFNGQPLDRSWLSAQELHAGGRLVVTLGPEPSEWGRDGVRAEQPFTPEIRPNPEMLSSSTL
ncbi:MAG: glycoside hydrolase family 92 protein [Microlunatus sp.]